MRKESTPQSNRNRTKLKRADPGRDHAYQAKRGQTTAKTGKDEFEPSLANRWPGQRPRQDSETATLDATCEGGRGPPPAAGAPPSSPPRALGSPPPRNAPPTRVAGGDARPPPGHPRVGPRPGGWARGRGRSCARNGPPTSQGAVCELRVKNGPSSVRKRAEPGRRRPDRAHNSPDHAVFESNPPESGPNSGQKRADSALKQAGKAGFV